jgi:Cu(I)/Ag(I) efflux system membrane fusion protein
MRSFILGFLLAVILTGGAWFLVNRMSTGEVAEQNKQLYYCPMHPTMISDKPGDCSICGMKLVPITDQAGASRHPDGSPPNQTMEASPEGYVPVTISHEKLQLIGVTTTEAKEMDLNQRIRTTGRIAPDERAVHHVHTKFDGFVEHVYADYTGRFVKRGEPLFSIYSPELLATQREYLLALKAKDSLQGDSPIGIDLLESARQRLTLWDIDEAQIAELERTRQPIKAVIIRSPMSGYVLTKTATHGMAVTPAENLYDIVDLSHVWVLADVYQTNLPLVKPGIPATVELPYEAEKKFTGKVIYIDPVLDPVSKTLKARIEIPNPDTALKPEMTVDITFGGLLVRGLVVPQSAVISTGERKIVFVDQGGGMFQPREVTTGASAQGFYEIRSGLKAGDRVVISGNFLLDSESRMRAAASGAHQH